MNWNRLSANQKLAVYGAVATLIGGILGGTLNALAWLAFLAAIAVLVVIFLPQLSPQTKLPGSEGSIVLGLGGVAAVILVLALLALLGRIDSIAQINGVGFLLAVAGSMVMTWAGWQILQAEGGKFTLGGGAPTMTPPPSEPSRPIEPPQPPQPSQPPEPSPMDEERDREG